MWHVHIRTKKEGECGPGMWIEGPNHTTIVDTGALDVYPLSAERKRTIEVAPDAVEACRLANQELLALGVGSSASPALRAIWRVLAQAEGRA